MFKSFTPLGREVPLECYSKTSEPMNFEELSKKLLCSAWAPLRHTVPNFEWLQQHIDEFSPTQQFVLVQFARCSNYGSMWFIDTVENTTGTTQQ